MNNKKNCRYKISFYQQNEEDEEDVGEKVDWAEESVCLLDGLEVEVAQDHPEERQDRRRESPEIVALVKIKKIAHLVRTGTSQHCDLPFRLYFEI
jgi:hypothetical protein